MTGSKHQDQAVAAAERLTDRLQKAWDSYPFGLPPIVFTVAEAEYLAAVLSTPAQSGEDRASLSAQLSQLYAAARGCEFDLVPADGPIAQLALFMHEQGDRVVAALSPDTSKVGAVDVREAQDRNRKKLIYAISTFCDNITLPGEDGDAAYDLLRQAAAQIGSDRQALERLRASPPPVEAGMRWRRIETWEGQPTGPAHPVILCVSDGGAHSPAVGEAWYDPDAYHGTWWWAGTRESDYGSSPIVEIQHGAPSHWMPMPDAPFSATLVDSGL